MAYRRSEELKKQVESNRSVRCVAAPAWISQYFFDKPSIETFLLVDRGARERTTAFKTRGKEVILKKKIEIKNKRDAKLATGARRLGETRNEEEKRETVEG